MDPGSALLLSLSGTTAWFHSLTLRVRLGNHLALLTCIATVRSLCQGTTFRSGRLAQMFL